MARLTTGGPTAWTWARTVRDQPEFYQRHGYVETGRTLGIPGDGEDVHMFKRLD